MDVDEDPDNSSRFTGGSSGGQSNGFKTAEGVSVTLVKGSIAVQSVNIVFSVYIFNSTANKFV